MSTESNLFVKPQRPLLVLVALLLLAGAWFASKFVLKELASLRSQLLSEQALLAYRQKNYSEAERLWRVELKNNQDDFEYVRTANFLGSLLVETDRCAEARPLLEKAYQISKSSSGENNLETAQSLRGLAFLCEKEGNYASAEDFYKRALQSQTKSAGDEQFATTSFMDNLASFYENRGCFGDAERLYKDALRIRKKIVGLESADTASSMNNCVCPVSRNGIKTCYLAGC
jgi:tetratricopeptide (TPR) repeat protein